MTDDNDSNGFREFEEFVKESFKKILASLQRQEMVLSSMLQNYSTLNLHQNQFGNGFQHENLAESSPESSQLMAQGSSQPFLVQNLKVILIEPSSLPTNQDSTTLFSTKYFQTLTTTDTNNQKITNTHHTPKITKNPTKNFSNSTKHCSKSI